MENSTRAGFKKIDKKNPYYTYLSTQTRDVPWLGAKNGAENFFMNNIKDINTSYDPNNFDRLSFYPVASEEYERYEPNIYIDPCVEGYGPQLGKEADFLFRLILIVIVVYYIYYLLRNQPS